MFLWKHTYKWSYPWPRSRLQHGLWWQRNVGFDSSIFCILLNNNDDTSSEACGGPNRLSVYTATGNVTALPVPVTQNTSLPDGWSYQGCLQ